MTHARTRKESTSKPSTSDKIVTMYVCFTRDMHTEPWLSQTNVSSISVNTSTKTHTRKNNPRSFQSVHSHLPLIHNSGGCNQYGFCSEFECGASLDSTLSIPLGVTKNLREKKKKKKKISSGNQLEIHWNAPRMTHLLKKEVLFAFCQFLCPK